VTVAKRSIVIRGHRTSVSLEPDFWVALKELAAREGRSPPDLIAEVDAGRRPGENLSSALRCRVLAAFRAAPLSAE
jgi:predicted DNA-binding ribbon-helix-helix protein